MDEEPTDNPFESPQADLGKGDPFNTAKVGCFWGAVFAIPFALFSLLSGWLLVQGVHNQTLATGFKAFLLLTVLTIFSGWCWAMLRGGWSWWRILGWSLVHGAFWTMGSALVVVLANRVRIADLVSPGHLFPKLFFKTWLRGIGYALLQGLVIQWRLQRLTQRQSSVREG